MDTLKELLQMVVPVKWLFSVMPFAASPHAHELDFLYWFLIVTCGILFLLVVVPLFIIIVRYRRKTPTQRAVSQKDHNFWMESLWTFLPLVYLAILFMWGFLQYLSMYVAPHDAKELRVVGQKWQWAVDYTKEQISVAGIGATFAVPINVPIKLVMSSQDVIHSFFVPNMRVKQDVVPGRYTVLWFTPNELGIYPVLCAEYCGDLHSNMLAKFEVMTEDAYDKWVELRKAQNEAIPLPELGERLYTELGCVTCHSTDGSIKFAPSFKGVYGKMEQLTDGTSMKIDDDYIRTKILTPLKHTAKGFPPIMPSFQGRVKDREISGLIEFIKSLSNK